MELFDKNNENEKYLIEKKLKASEERFSLAMRGANDGLWDWDLLTNEVYYSPRWKSMLGYKDHELENHLDTWKKLVYSKDKVIALDKVQTCIETNTSEFEIEMSMHHKNGSEIIVLSRAFLLRRDSDNKPIRLVGTHVDITQRKKAEEFAENTNTILKMIAIGKPAFDVYNSIALMYEARHPGMRCSLLELEDGKLLQGGAPSMPKEYGNAIHGIEIGPEVGSCGASTYTGKRVIVENIETDPKWKDIKCFALPHGLRCCWSEPIIDSRGKVLGAFGMYYDYPALPNDEESKDLLSASRLSSIVMERDQAHKRNIQDEKFIAEQSKLAAMGEMIGNIAHQWRQPLSVISTGVTGLKIQNQQNILTDQILHTTCDMIDVNSQYLSRTIDDFRNFIKGDRSKVHISIKNNINSFLSIVDGTIKKHDITIILNIEDSVFESYPNELIQCYINIFNNSLDILKTLDGNRYVFISSYLEDNQLVIAFKDNAGGISENIRARIFEPYFTTKHKSQGTGLGLHITYDLIINGMKGNIEVENDFYKYQDKYYNGLEFRILLPIK